MPRGLKTSSGWDPDAGQRLDDDQPAASPAPASAAAAPAPPLAPVKQPSDTIRQTLDLSRQDYRALHHHTRAIAETHGYNSREFNAQTMLRALVKRMLSDDKLLNDVAKDVLKSLNATNA